MCAPFYEIPSIQVPWLQWKIKRVYGPKIRIFRSIHISQKQSVKYIKSVKIFVNNKNTIFKQQCFWISKNNPKINNFEFY